MTTRQALLNFFFWVTVAMLLNAGILIFWGEQPAAEFFGAFVMEKALSLDNLFMFYVIFRLFNTPHEVRPKLLRWGIIGVVIMRGAIILGGTAIISNWRPLLWFFAAFLFWAAFKVFFLDNDDGGATQEDLEKNWLVRFAKRFLGFENRYDGDKFFTVVNGKKHGTLLLLTLMVIEGTDVPFAFDSLPAAMAISQNFFIVLSSNVLAVLGLRAIYFLIENMQERFAHMKQGIGLLLAIGAVKILLPDLGRIVNSTLGLVYPAISEKVAPDFGYHVPLPISVGIIASVIVGTFLYTLIRTRGGAAPAETA
jgi:tellurite resistance protein TerC